MDNVVTQEVFKRIDALAEKLGTTAEYMWPKLVAYTQGVAIAELILVGGMFSATVLIFIISMRTGLSNDWEDTSTRVAAVISGLLSALLLIAVLGAGPDTIARVFSPEAAAFYKLVGK